MPGLLDYLLSSQMLNVPGQEAWNPLAQPPATGAPLQLQPTPPPAGLMPKPQAPPRPPPLSFMSSNPNMLLGLGMGMLSGKNNREAFASGLQGMLLGRKADTEEKEKREKEQEKERQLALYRKAFDEIERSGVQFPATLAEAIQSNPELAAKTLADYATSRFERMNKPTDDIREWEFARQQGYKGSFADWQIEGKKAGASQVNIGQSEYGTIPQGYELFTDPQTNARSMRPIPGGPAAMEAEKGIQQEAAQLETSAGKARTMLDTVGEIKAIAKEAKTPYAGTTSIPFSLYSETPAAKVRAHVRTLQSGVALQAMMRLKAASATGATGFGQMNARELQLLIDDIGVLDADMSPDIFMQTVERIGSRFDRVIEDIKKNVAPERIRELGLEEFLEAEGSDAFPPGVSEADIEFTMKKHGLS